MRIAPWIALSFGASLLASACASEPGGLLDPPRLTITSPQRATMRESGGLVQVTGQVAPNAAGDRVSQVTVNGVVAQLAADGTFAADVQVPPGATLLHTVARDVAGGEATDTRGIQVGAFRSGADFIDNGVGVALSDDALATIATVAGTLMKTTDFAPILAPLNPMVSAGAEDGEDCLWAKVSITDVNLGNARFTLVPRAGGLSFSAEVTNLDVPGTARYKAACFIGGTTDLRMTASKITVAGTVQVTPAPGGAGFKVKIVSPDVSVTGFNLQAGSLSTELLGMLDLNNAIGSIVSVAAEHFMSPLMTRALGGLAGPKRLDLLGKSIDFEMRGDAAQFDVVSAKVALDTRMHLTDSSARFVYTQDAPIALEAGSGFAVAISDDTANQLLASVTAAGMLNLSMPAPGGTFDTARISATSAPMIAADTATGKLRIVASDLAMTFMSGDTEVTHVALSLATEISAEPSGYGGVKLNLTRPEVFADVLDNSSGYVDDDQEQMIKLVVDHQVDTISLLLGNIPLPAIAGVSMKDLRVEGVAGYVKVSGGIQAN